MNVKKEFKKDHELLDDIERRLFDARESYNAGKIDKKYNKKDVDVDALQQKVNDLRSEEAEIREAYAKHAFSYFSAHQPQLIRDTSKEKISWIDAFGDSFEKLDIGLKNSLVALIEEDGGQYRLS